MGADLGNGVCFSYNPHAEKHMCELKLKKEQHGEKHCAVDGGKKLFKLTYIVYHAI